MGFFFSSSSFLHLYPPIPPPPASHPSTISLEPPRTLNTNINSVHLEVAGASICMMAWLIGGGGRYEGRSSSGLLCVNTGSVKHRDHSLWRVLMQLLESSVTSDADVLVKHTGGISTGHLCLWVSYLCISSVHLYETQVGKYLRGTNTISEESVCPIMLICNEFQEIANTFFYKGGVRTVT